MEKFSVFRPSEGSTSQAPPLGVIGKGCLLDTVALPGHNRTCRSILGLLVGSAKACNKPASSNYFGFNLNYVDVPHGNANALHAHKAFEYFMAMTGDFEIRAGDNARSSTILNKFDMILIPAYYKRYFKCVATKEQMHFCKEMEAHSEGQCALLLSGIVGPAYVKWAPETVEQARKNKVTCTDTGVLYDKDTEPPKEEAPCKELDCSQKELESFVVRAADRGCISSPYGDGDMRFEYVDVRPGEGTAWKADPARNYCVWLLEGPDVIVQGGVAEDGTDFLTPEEVLVVPKGQEWSLCLPEESKQSALVYLISGSITEASFPEDVLQQLGRVNGTSQNPSKRVRVK
eukprot:TRINITY_DN29659_c0_g1_i1.p1 TRINITY_DN29659_c0_g1~~TRINITY_DN29659_c0_g1_i1.p1  ORF type:complete len:345 (-),score=65.73 TRINITY_DN29659_c0_g1_i1:16-1050(-)